MNFCSNKSLLVASCLLISNVNSSELVAHNAINSVGGILEDNNISSSIITNNINNNQYSAITDQGMISNIHNPIDSSDPIVPNHNEDSLISELQYILTSNEYISIADRKSYAEFNNNQSMDYVNSILKTLQNNSKGILNNQLLKRNDYNRVIEIIPNIKAEDLMRFSLIFNCMLSNNSEKKYAKSYNYDQLEIYKIFCNINSDIKNKINTSEYKLDLYTEFFYMIIAEYCELLYNEKIHDCQGLIALTPVIDLICKEVNNSKNLVKNISIINSNSDKLSYNLDALHNIAKNNELLKQKDKQKYLAEIDNIYTGTNGINAWNKMVNFVHAGKENIKSEYGTNAYWEEYQNKNPLMKTLKQSIILFNKIFNDNNN